MIDLIAQSLYDPNSLHTEKHKLGRGGTMIDLEKALKFPTTDREWKQKVLIGGVLNILPVINFFPLGYAYGIFRRTLRRQEISLPEWENWGDLFVQGLMVFLICLIYNIASLILFAIHPVLGVLAFIAVFLLLPTALAQHAMSGDFSRAFQLKNIWARIQQTKSDYFFAWLVMVGISVVLMMVTVAIPILGWIISAIIGFYAYLVFAILFGEICSRPGPLSQNSSEPPSNER